MTDIEVHQQYLQTEILRLLCYGATIGRAFSQEEIRLYLQTSANPLPIKKAIDTLFSSKKIAQIGKYYGLANKKYTNPNNSNLDKQYLINKLRQRTLLFRIVTPIKALIVIDDVAFTTASRNDNIDLLIITKPARIYLSKFALNLLLKLFNLLANSKTSTAKFNPKIFLTTGGINFNKDLTNINNPHNIYRLIMAEPIFGADLWYTMLQKQAELGDKFPNIVWPKTSYKMFGKGINFLDKIDEIGYKRYLKKISTRKLAKSDNAFIRIRPDIITIDYNDPSAKIAEQYAKYCSKYGLDTKGQNS